MANKKSRKKVSTPVYKRAWFTVLLVLALCMAACGAFAAIYLLPTHEGKATWVYIPGGASESAVRDSMVSQLGAVQGGRVYRIWSMLGSSPSVAHGAYRVEPGQAAWTTARNISRGRQTPVRVSWNSVRTLDQMAEAVSRNLEFSEGDFLAACEEVLGPEGFDEATYAAAFLPDTYEFYWGTHPRDVVKKLYGYRQKFWTDERVAKARELGLDPVGVATIASIVEEETAKADERPAVARLYINRLKAGMPLQADPTVKFAIGDFGIKRITHEMLKTPSPYNTYRNQGLPPGPIRIADKATLEAVLSAPAHDYLYMCAKEDFSGYHNFAKDYATHMANARRYQSELDRRGIH